MDIKCDGGMTGQWTVWKFTSVSRRNSMALRSSAYCTPSRPCLAAPVRPMSDEYERRRLVVLNEIEWGLSYGA